jgi:hypothetical protein
VIIISRVSESNLAIHRFFTTLTNVVFGLIMILLGLRFVFRLFGANPDSAFTQWLYGTSGELMDPFRGIFPTPTTSQGFVLDLPALVALIIYALVAALLVYLFNIFLAPAEERELAVKSRRDQSI